MMKVICFCLLLITGCLEPESAKIFDYATIEEVRIITSEKELLIDGNPVAGALVGSMVAGTPGAVVGAALGDDKSVSRRHIEIDRCQVIVKTDHGKRLRWIYRDDDAKTTATYKKGDRITLERTGSGGYHWEGIKSFQLNLGEVIP